MAGEVYRSMIYLLLATTAATAGLCFFARPLSNWLQVFDYPRGGRKQHANPTPQVGGLAILLPLVGCLLALWALHPGQPLYLALLLCGAGVGVIGIMDDQSHLSASGRLLVLTVFTLIAFALDPHLAARAIPWATFGPTPLPAWVFITCAVLATAGFVSSVNMADGIDGLVPAALLLWCIGFDLFADGAVRAVAIAITGPALVVLAFNLRGLVFLGDCGTFGVGFIVALLALASLGSGKLSAETLLVWFCMPVIDCLRVLAARLVAGRSPLRGGKDHFHHILADIFGKKRALYFYVAVIFTTSAIAALAPRSSFYILVGLTALCFGFVAARRALYQRWKIGQPVERTRGRAGQPAALTRSFSRTAVDTQPPPTRESGLTAS
jgi:UDP-GlcNAc:undecaprenyl-phosphate/decaprenyl-phosphate GlcNAc-1-phosphate transferase